MAINRGSQWGKWDLHVHTPLSFESRFGMTTEEREDINPIAELEGIDTPQRYEPQLWAKYVQQLEAVDWVDCLGVTDYFSIEGYELLEGLQNEGYLDDFDLILPNIEFRLDTITGEGNRINVHVVFSDELTVSVIRNEFLRNLRIRINEGNELTLRPDSLRELGRRAREMYDDQNLSEYAAGCKYARIKFDQILEELQSTSIFDGNYIIILSGAEWHEIDWNSQDADKKRQLLATSHGLFSGSPNDQEWAIGQGDLTVEEFRNIFGSLKPVFHGSDSHDFETLCLPDEDRFCWLKTRNTFEGLKQVIFEPRDRLNVGSTHPQSFTQIQTIDSLSLDDGFVNSELSIQEVDLPFNSNLVTVIGSQGTGKTALLDFIANCYEDRRRENADDENSFIARIQDSNPRINTSLTFVGDDVEPFSKSVLDAETVEGPDLLYVPQGKIVEYCEKGEKLHDRIMKLVTESVANEIPEEVSQFETKNEEISELAGELRRFNAELHEINPPEVRDNRREEEAKLSEAETLLNNKTSEIEEFRETREEELEETEAEELQDKLDELRQKHQELQSLEEDIQDARSKLDSLHEFNSLVDDIEDGLDLIETDIELEKFELSGQRDRLESLLDAVEESSSSITDEIEEVRENLDELSAVDEQLSELRDEERRIREQINQIENRISTLDEQLDRIEELNDERKEYLVQYVEAYLELKSMYGDIADEFAEEESEILSDIELEPIVELTEDRTGDYVDLLDMRSVNDDDIKDGLFHLKNIVQGDAPSDLDESVNDYIDEIEEFREDTLSGVEPIEFDGLLYDDCLTLSEEMYYQGTPMSQLSRGQKGTVLLKIYLAEGENPLIIDTPEDNLDNRFVFDELIHSIRDAKTNRQIFIATHDANLVVNTDSEQVVITKFDEGDIEFEAGALEDQSIRSEAKDILEGGDEAFRRREEKYRLSPR